MMIKKYIFNLRNSIKYPFYAMLWLYQKCLSPFLGRYCRFMPTCSDYCRMCLDHLPLHRVIWLTCRRIVRCNPLCGVGYDPPPLDFIKNAKDRI